MSFLRGHAFLTEVLYDCLNFNFGHFLSLIRPSPVCSKFILESIAVKIYCFYQRCWIRQNYQLTGVSFQFSYSKSTGSRTFSSNGYIFGKGYWHGGRATMNSGYWHGGREFQMIRQSGHLNVGISSKLFCLSCTLILYFCVKQQSFRMSIVSRIIYTLLSFWHKARKGNILLEIGEAVIQYYDRVDFGQWKKETSLMIEFGYPTQEASNDNMGSHIYSNTY